MHSSTMSIMERLTTNPKQISVVTLDIETSTEGGFPDIETANQSITAITVRKNGQSLVLGLRPYTSKARWCEILPL